MKWFKKNKIGCDDISNDDEHYEVKVKGLDEVLYCDDYKVSLPYYTDKGEKKLYFLYVNGKRFVIFAEDRIERMEKVNYCNCCCHCGLCEHRIKII